ALHIVAVTTLAVLFVIFGAGIRLGGLTISF
ncbi:MAG: copper resistance protein CopD, partial [Microcystis sp.]